PGNTSSGVDLRLAGRGARRRRAGLDLVRPAGISWPDCLRSTGPGRRLASRFRPPLIQAVVNSARRLRFSPRRPMRRVRVYELRATTTFRAPIERVFDLARSVEAHLASSDGTAEAAVAGRTSGLLELGETVTWRARHFGVTQHLTTRITAFDRPHHFQDRM